MRTELADRRGVVLDAQERAGAPLTATERVRQLIATRAKLAGGGYTPGKLAELTATADARAVADLQAIEAAEAEHLAERHATELEAHAATALPVEELSAMQLDALRHGSVTAVLRVVDTNSSPDTRELAITRLRALAGEEQRRGVMAGPAFHALVKVQGAPRGAAPANDLASRHRRERQVLSERMREVAHVAGLDRALATAVARARAEAFAASMRAATNEEPEEQHHG